jgi:hypothetical protein
LLLSPKSADLGYTWGHRFAIMQPDRLGITGITSIENNLALFRGFDHGAKS